MATTNDLKIATAEEDTAGFYYSNNNAASASANNRDATSVIDSPYFLNSDIQMRTTDDRIDIPLSSISSELKKNTDIDIQEQNQEQAPAQAQDAQITSDAHMRPTFMKV